MILCKCSYNLIVFALIVSATLLTGIAVSTAENTMQKVEMEMPVLRGDIWIKMSDDEKISFIWGAGHVVTIEEVIMRDDPGYDKDKSFIARVIEASVNSPMKMHEVADKVDAYYQNNPDKLSTPVVEVIWFETIEPRLGKEDKK